ncbi:plasmid p 4b orf-3 family protein, partial [Rhypophila decipiens]
VKKTPRRWPKSEDNLQRNDITLIILCPDCRAIAYCSATCRVESLPSHKAVCIPENYVLRVQLLPRQIVDPPVERTLSCPARATFYQLQQVLQVAFGWASAHLFEFSVKGNSHSLSIGDPDDDDDFGFIDDSNASMGRPRTTRKSSVRFKLCKYFEDEKFWDDQTLEPQTLMYEYDFGDGWEHDITLVNRAPATKKFVCVSGTGHEVAEDVGGSYGWEDLKNIYRIPMDQLTPDQRERQRWFERRASNGDPRGLGGDRVNFFDLTRCNIALSRVRVAK